MFLFLKVHFTTVMYKKGPSDEDNDPGSWRLSPDFIDRSLMIQAHHYIVPFYISQYVFEGPFYHCNVQKKVHQMKTKINACAVLCGSSTWGTLPNGSIGCFPISDDITIFACPLVQLYRICKRTQYTVWPGLNDWNTCVSHWNSFFNSVDYLVWTKTQNFCFCKRWASQPRCQKGVSYIKWKIKQCAICSTSLPTLCQRMFASWDPFQCMDYWSNNI